MKSFFSDLESIIEDFGRVSPILSPPQQPSSRLPPLTHNDGVPSLKCVMDVSALQLADRRRLQAKLSSLVLLLSCLVFSSIYSYDS